MEIRNYFRTIGKYIWWFLVPLFVVIVVTLILSMVYSQSYEAPVSFAINRKPQQRETTDYQFDNYYAIQANIVLSVQFTDWLKGNSVISSIYQRAGLEEKSAGILQKEWKVTNHSPQDVEIVFRGRDKNRVAKLAESAIETVTNKRDEFAGTGDAAIGTVTVPGEVLVSVKKAALTLNILVGLAAGVLIGLIFVYFKAIFSEEDNK